MLPYKRSLDLYGLTIDFDRFLKVRSCKLSCISMFSLAHDGKRRWVEICTLLHWDKIDQDKFRYPVFSRRPIEYGKEEALSLSNCGSTVESNFHTRRRLVVFLIDGSDYLIYEENKRHFCKEKLLFPSLKYDFRRRRSVLSRELFLSEASIAGACEVLFGMKMRNNRWVWQLTPPGRE